MGVLLFLATAPVPSPVKPGWHLLFPFGQSCFSPVSKFPKLSDYPSFIFKVNRTDKMSGLRAKPPHSRVVPGPWLSLLSSFWITFLWALLLLFC